MSNENITYYSLRFLPLSRFLSARLPGQHCYGVVWRERYQEVVLPEGFR